MTRVLVAALVACACAPAHPDGGGVDAAHADAGRPDAGLPGTGPDPAVVAHCLSCHDDIAPDWSLVSSHSLLLDCTTCHLVVSQSGGPGHVQAPPCRTCHSELGHPDPRACTRCHTPHGSTNAFLVRPELVVTDGSTVPVTLAAPEGASAAGLVRAGADGGAPGTGVCEACHTTTRYFRAAGDGAPHETGWCLRCHDHQRGFSPP